MKFKEYREAKFIRSYASYVYHLITIPNLYSAALLNIEGIDFQCDSRCQIELKSATKDNSRSIDRFIIIIKHRSIYGFCRSRKANPAKDLQFSRKGPSSNNREDEKEKQSFHVLTLSFIGIESKPLIFGANIDYSESL